MEAGAWQLGFSSLPLRLRLEVRIHTVLGCQAEQIFNALDSNHDGKLSREQFVALMKMKQAAAAQMPPMPQPHVQMPQMPQGKAAMQPAMQLMQQPQAQLQPCVNVPMPPQMRLQMQMQQRMTLQVQPQVTQSHAPGPQQIPLANAPRPQVEQVFNTLDSNHDGKLSREEFAHLIKMKQAAGAQMPPMPQPQVQMQHMPCANVPVRLQMQQLQTQPQMRHSHAPGPQQILLPPTFHQGQVQQMPCANVPMPPLPGQAMTGAFVPSADVIWRMQQAQGQQLDEMLKQMKDLCLRLHCLSCCSLG